MTEIINASAWALGAAIGLTLINIYKRVRLTPLQIAGTSVFAFIVKVLIDLLFGLF